MIETISWFDDRFYRIGNEYYVSVTTILSQFAEPYLLDWYGNVGTERAKYKSRLAKERGSIIHEACYRLKQGETLRSEEFNQDIWLAINRYEEYYTSLKPQLIANELTIYDTELMIAGTLDDLIYLSEAKKYNLGLAKEIELPPGFYVADIKTGNPSFKHFIQLSAYAEMVKKNELINGEEITGTLLIYLDSTTKQGWKVEYHDKEQIKQDYDEFLAFYLIYKRNFDKRPKILEMKTEISLINYNKE